ncbi:hypothetical protein BC936DRAFT_145433 [Jimgerdemannia flammicorona]|uniref:Uncharacterized protein n=1 Tax=Jimgerdemannia flammicorona TaxID=994334 RepID=A0A433DA28_9FUNG|nr:hypothetical protein BC936DRAFT_145433 [Jimgerdemannia flammicorona]
MQHRIITGVGVRGLALQFDGENGKKENLDGGSGRVPEGPAGKARDGRGRFQIMRYRIFLPEASSLLHAPCSMRLLDAPVSGHVHLAGLELVMVAFLGHGNAGHDNGKEGAKAEDCAADAGGAGELEVNNGDIAMGITLRGETGGTYTLPWSFVHRVAVTEPVTVTELVPVISMAADKN